MHGENGTTSVDSDAVFGEIGPGMEIQECSVCDEARSTSNKFEFFFIYETRFGAVFAGCSNKKITLNFLLFQYQTVRI